MGVLRIFNNEEFGEIRTIMIFLVVSRKKRNFGGRIKCLKGEYDYGKRNDFQ